MLATASRPDDTVRPIRPYHDETNADPKEQTYLPPHSRSNTFAARDEPSQRPTRAAPAKLLSPEEIIALTQRTVDTGVQETKRSLAGSEGVEGVVRPKLTIDLGHSNIGSVPDEVVDIIKDEVARLSLSNNHINQIPLRFCECVHLRYLNIRANSFTEFPKEAYNLSFLEILDLSRNKITVIPPEVRNLTSLRVLSVMQNLLDDLPDELCEMNKLQVLKVSGNALKYPLKGVLEMKEAEVTASELLDSEKESAVTAELKKFLKSRQPVPTRDGESSSDTAEPIPDTPKPARRGDRFPVIPRTGGTGTGSAHDARSPSFSRPPPIPSRSHRRIVSGQSNSGFQNNATYHRSGFSFANSNSSERYRSNSESFIQASLPSRNRRTGMAHRKNTDLGTLDETRAYRNSHLRGLSHGSVLRAQPSAMTNGHSSSTPSSPDSPQERTKALEAPLPRLTSIPESRTKSDGQSHPVIEAVKGTLYSLFQVHSQISLLINVVSTEDKRSTLEIIFYNAAVYLEHLNETLENGNKNTDSDDDRRLKKTVPALKNECEACIMSYIHVGSQLRAHASKIISLTDPKYVRSLLLQIFSSLVELRNAASYLGVDTRHHDTNTTSDTGKRTLRDRIMEPAATPPRERHQPHQRRFRSDATMQHSTGPAPYPQPPPPISTSQANYAATPPPPPIPPTVPLNLGSRSRSSSRSNTMLNSSASSSCSNTPRSNESFPTITPATSAASRINPVTGLDEFEEERVFERIFVQLTDACRSALQALPVAARQFNHYLEMAEENMAQQALRNLWSRLVRRCRACVEASETLNSRLSKMKVKEPGGGTRNRREFWQLCKTFIVSFVGLVTDMGELKHLRLLPQEIVMTLRPVQMSSREAGRLINASPWAPLAELNGSSTNSTGSQQRSTSSLSTHSAIPTSAATNGSSPQSIQIPATPLGAALGPAAQATVPSTPASASRDKFFAGDIFQRADSLLSIAHQAGPAFARR